MARKKRKAARPVRSNKMRLSQSEEFEIMKLVLDKFLWLGFGVMAFGLYHAIQFDIADGLYYIISGAVVLLALTTIIVKEFEFIR